MQEHQPQIRRANIVLIGNTTSLFLAITYIICVSFDLLMPEMAMHTAWEIFLPGFVWLSFASFVLGLVETYAYGWYVALLWGALYNVFNQQKVAPPS